MHPEQRQFLSLAVAPARLNVQETSWYLGFQEHDIAVLIASGLLRPLGRPRPNSVKYFAVVDLERLRSDSKWLGKATEALQAHWRRKNKVHGDMDQSGESNPTDGRDAA